MISIDSHTSEIQDRHNTVFTTVKSCDTGVDKVALMARCLVKTISMYMINCFCCLFMYFIHNEYYRSAGLINHVRK